MEKEDVCVSKIKPDKSLAGDEIRKLFTHEFTSTSTDQQIHFHEGKLVRFCPYSIFMDNIQGQKIFFVKGNIIGNGKIFLPIPVFMLNLSPQQKEIITQAGKIKKIKIKPKHFERPQIACSQEEAVEMGFRN